MSMEHKDGVTAVPAPHACLQQLSGNRALDVLREAMGDVGIKGNDRDDLIGYFTRRWTAAVGVAPTEGGNSK